MSTPRASRSAQNRSTRNGVPSNLRFGMNSDADVVTHFNMQPAATMSVVSLQVRRNEFPRPLPRRKRPKGKFNIMSIQSWIFVFVAALAATFAIPAIAGTSNFDPLGQVVRIDMR